MTTKVTFKCRLIRPGARTNSLETYSIRSNDNASRCARDAAAPLPEREPLSDRPPTESEAIADFALNLDLATVPPAVVDLAREHFLDV